MEEAKAIKLAAGETLVVLTDAGTIIIETNQISTEITAQGSKRINHAIAHGSDVINHLRMFTP